MACNGIVKYWVAPFTETHPFTLNHYNMEILAPNIRFKDSKQKTDLVGFFFEKKIISFCLAFLFLYIEIAEKTFVLFTHI